MTFAVAANEKGEKVLTMSKEYIERQRAIVDACNSLELYPSEYAKLEDALNRIPAADVVEVRHGRWESTGVLVGLMNFEYFYRCTACGRRGGDTKTNYCPNCGASMDKGQNEK